MKIKGFNARRAVRYGHKLTTIQRAILIASDPCCHTEAQFSYIFNNISFSATLANDWGRARFEDISYSHPEYWDTVDIPMTREQEEVAMAAAARLEGTPYDEIGVTSLATKYDIIKPDPDKTWCSKACAMVICAGRPDFKLHLDSLGLGDFNIDPQVLMDEARCYFHEKR